MKKVFKTILTICMLFMLVMPVSADEKMININVNIIMYRFDQLRMYNQDILNWLFFSNIFITLL